MPIFTDPKEFKKHKEYVKLLKKALKKVKADTPKKFVYFKKYNFEPKKEPLLLVDYDPACQKAVIGEGLVITAKGNVTLTPDDKLDFQPKEGKIPRIKLQRYFKAMSPELKPIHIPQGEVDEDDDDDSSVEETASNVFSESLSSDTGGVDEKVAARLNEHIATLQQQQFPPETQEKKEPALNMARKLVAEGKYAEATKLLKLLAVQAKLGQASGSKQPVSSSERDGPGDEKLENEANQVFAEALSTDEPKLEEEADAVFSESASSDTGSLDEKLATRLNQHIAALQQQQFPPETQAKKEPALNMARKLVAEGKYAEATKLLKLLAVQAKLGQASASQEPVSSSESDKPVGEKLEKEADQAFAESSSADAVKTDPTKQATDKLNQQIAALKQTNFPPDQKANKESTLAKAQKLVTEGKHYEATRLLNGLAEMKARLVRITTSQNSLSTMGPRLVPDEKNSFPPGVTKAIDKATNRAVGGHGPVFKPVLKALEAVEKSPEEKHLAALELAAKNYLADYDRRVSKGDDKGKPFKPDKITTKKVESCKDAIERVRKLRVTRDIQNEMAKLPQNPQTPDEEAAVNRLKAKMIVESGGSKQLGDDESGASESFFLTDPTTGGKAFIFKPADGEFDAGYGWEKGGGAPREVVLSAVNEALKDSIGLDCGVSQTTLVAVDNPSVATARNGNNPRRTGAVQSFVNSDRELSRKMEEDDDFINQVPVEDIEKVALLDFATLQMDRQASNLLVQKDAEGKPRLIPIDAGNAMPSRKAFEASRRMFTNNAVLAGDEAKKPFSADALQKINDIDADAIVAAMEKANADMAAIDPGVASAVNDENIEMTRRSIQFLKKAAPQLTKAEIADAYAYEFQKVLDAKPKDVDKAIDKAIKATLAKPALIDAINKNPNASQEFIDLGWPRDEFESLKAESPSRLLDILTKKTECPATLKMIQEGIAEVGIKNFKTDPNTIKSLDKRLTEVKSALTIARDAKLLNDPELEKNRKKAGADYMVVDPKTNEKKPMLEVYLKPLIRKVNSYLEGGGDDAIKRLGKSPKKMSFEEKYFEMLGGDALIEELMRKGLNPYDGSKLDIKIDDLIAYKEFVTLGGEEEYVRLGCPQNKEINLDTRCKLMKSRLGLE